MNTGRLLILFFSIAGWLTCAVAQDSKGFQANKQTLPLHTDTPLLVKDTTTGHLSFVKKDTIARHNPSVATRRSALIPGWGQAYNKEYWKIPLVYGVLAIPAGMYFYNNSFYNKTKFAYEARFKATAGDTSDVALIDPQLKGLGLTSLQSYRNAFRRDRDYSILWFLLAWGLQVADATVFAHLKEFDVSGDLSMQVHPTFNPFTRTPGLGVSLHVKNPSHKPAITR